MNSFILKIIAIITMTFDHIGYLIFGKLSYFNYIGRFAFPIFAFQISEGYTHTKNLRKYMSRLAIFALISQIPFVLFHVVIYKNTGTNIVQDLLLNKYGLNIFFTLLLGLFAIFSFDKFTVLRGNKFINTILALAVGLLLCYIGDFLKVDYGFYGVAIILLFYIFRAHKLLMALSFILATILKYSERLYLLLINNLSNIHNYTTTIILCLFTLLPIIFILLYNGKKGRNIKYLLYFFYPVHLLLIYFIYSIMTY